MQIGEKINRDDDYELTGATILTDALLTVFEGRLGVRRVLWGTDHQANSLIRKARDESADLAAPIVRQVFSPWAIRSTHSDIAPLPDPRQCDYGERWLPAFGSFPRAPSIAVFPRDCQPREVWLSFLIRFCFSWLPRRDTLGRTTGKTGMKSGEVFRIVLCELPQSMLFAKLDLATASFESDGSGPEAGAHTLVIHLNFAELVAKLEWAVRFIKGPITTSW
jgi:hypothetical protein